MEVVRGTRVLFLRGAAPPPLEGPFPERSSASQFGRAWWGDDGTVEDAAAVEAAGADLREDLRRVPPALLLPDV